MSCKHHSILAVSEYLLGLRSVPIWGLSSSYRLSIIVKVVIISNPLTVIKSLDPGETGDWRKPPTVGGLFDTANFREFLFRNCLENSLKSLLIEYVRWLKAAK
jgi:hypothetical protein